jgi:phospholipid/cholesterol/gamma-HCH transport system permease protein
MAVRLFSSYMRGFFIAAGNAVLDGLRYVGKLSILAWEAMTAAVSAPLNWHRFLVQAERVGPGSFLITSLVGLFVGMIIALQMAYMMVRLSAEIYIPNVIAVSLARELGPVLTALIVAGRIGAGVTAEIGTMLVTEQIDALRAFAVSPVRYLVVPRFLALVVMLPVLTLFSVGIGIFGGFIICSFKLSINTHTYWSMVLDSLAVKDVATGLLKTVFFGMIIAIVGCYEGLNVRGGADGVGKATTLSVVRSFIFIIMVDCFLTFIFYFLFNS